MLCEDCNGRVIGCLWEVSREGFIRSHLEGQHLMPVFHTNQIIVLHFNLTSVIFTYWQSESVRGILGNQNCVVFAINVLIWNFMTTFLEINRLAIEMQLQSIVDKIVIISVVAHFLNDFDEL